MRSIKQFISSNKFYKAQVVLLAAAGMYASVNAVAATATSNADATIITAISISNTAGLDFGSVVADAATAGSVTMTAAGARTCATVTCAVQDAGAASAFSVTGQANYTYAISLPASATLKIGVTTNQMTVDTFTDSKSGTGTLSASGTDTFTVGAKLSVGAAQVAGAYTGTFDVTVNYN